VAVDATQSLFPLLRSSLRRTDAGRLARGFARLQYPAQGFDERSADARLAAAVLPDTSARRSSFENT
jgi:hypothetical protein